MKTKRSRMLRLFAVVFAAVMLTVAVHAYPSTKNYTYDGTGTLTEKELTSIADVSKKLSEKKGARIAVCVVNSVIQVGAEEARGSLEATVKDYARAVFKEWDVGNGVLLLVAKEDGVYWAVQSNSLTDTLTDAKLSAILEENLDGGFSENGDLSESIIAAVDALDEFLTEKLPDAAAEKSLISKIFGVILKIVVAVAILLIVGYVVLVILERRALEKKRQYMEARRRAMAARGRNGAGAYRRPPNPQAQNGMRQGYGSSFEYASVYDPSGAGAPGRMNPQSGAQGGVPANSAAPDGNRRGDLTAGRTVAFPTVRRAGNRSAGRAPSDRRSADRYDDTTVYR